MVSQKAKSTAMEAMKLCARNLRRVDTHANNPQTTSTTNESHVDIVDLAACMADIPRDIDQHNTSETCQQQQIDNVNRVHFPELNIDSQTLTALETAFLSDNIVLPHIAFEQLPLI